MYFFSFFFSIILALWSLIFFLQFLVPILASFCILLYSVLCAQLSFLSGGGDLYDAGGMVALSSCSSCSDLCFELSKFFRRWSAASRVVVIRSGIYFTSKLTEAY